MIPFYICAHATCHPRPWSGCIRWQNAICPILKRSSSTWHRWLTSDRSCVHYVSGRTTKLTRHALHVWELLFKGCITILSASFWATRMIWKKSFPCLAEKNYTCDCSPCGFTWKSRSTLTFNMTLVTVYHMDLENDEVKVWGSYHLRHSAVFLMLLH